MSERALPEAFALPRGVLAQQTALAHTERSLGRHHRQSGTRERLRAASRRRRAVRLVSIVHEPARRAIEAVEKNDRNYRNATHLPAVLTYEPDPAFPPLVLPPAVLAPQHRHRRTPRSRESNPAAARCVLRLRAAPVAHPSDVLAAGRSGALEVPYSLASCSAVPMPGSSGGWTHTTPRRNRRRCRSSNPRPYRTAAARAARSSSVAATSRPCVASSRTTVGGLPNGRPPLFASAVSDRALTLPEVVAIRRPGSVWVRPDGSNGRPRLRPPADAKVGLDLRPDNLALRRSLDLSRRIARVASAPGLRQGNP